MVSLKGENRSHEASFASLSKDTQALKKIAQAQEKLEKEGIPELRGWFVQERKALLVTNKELREVLLDIKKMLVETSALFSKTDTYIQELMRGLTKLMYTIRWSMIIFMALYVKNHLR